MMQRGYTTNAELGCSWEDVCGDCCDGREGIGVAEVGGLFHYCIAKLHFPAIRVFAEGCVPTPYVCAAADGDVDGVYVGCVCEWVECAIQCVCVVPRDPPVECG